MGHGLAGIQRRPRPLRREDPGGHPDGLDRRSGLTDATERSLWELFFPPGRPKEKTPPWGAASTRSVRSVGASPFWRAAVMATTVSSSLCSLIPLA
ncbi:hypothetical protein G6F32_016179 [Rhizopus arrhizus]|nr:hypothetical protein G6F32_016179 [Rhizopus arrhizus]